MQLPKDYLAVLEAHSFSNKLPELPAWFDDQSALGFETVFSQQLGGPKTAPSKALLNANIEKVSHDLSMELKRFSNELALNGNAIEFSIAMPRLGKVNVQANATSNILLLRMQTDSWPFREKLKANVQQMEKSVRASVGKVTRIRVVDDE